MYGIMVASTFLTDEIAKFAFLFDFCKLTPVWIHGTSIDAEMSQPSIFSLHVQCPNQRMLPDPTLL